MKTLILTSVTLGLLVGGYAIATQPSCNQFSSYNGMNSFCEQAVNKHGERDGVAMIIKYNKEGASSSGDISQGVFQYLTLDSAVKTIKTIKGVL